MSKEKLRDDLKDKLQSMIDIVSGVTSMTVIYDPEHLFVLKILALQSVLTEVLEAQVKQMMAGDMVQKKVREVGYE